MVYKYQYLESKKKRQTRIIAGIYVLLVMVAVTAGIGIRFQQIRNIQVRPGEAAVTPYPCPFCPAQGQDPYYNYEPIVSIVYCKANNGVNIPLNESYWSDKTKKVIVKHKGSGDDTSYKVETDPNGVVKFPPEAYPSFLSNWHSGKHIRLYRSVDLSDLPDKLTITYKGKNYSFSKASATYTNPDCPDNVMSPFNNKGDTDDCGEAQRDPADPYPCCEFDASGSISCYPNCYIGDGEICLERGNISCTGKEIYSGFNPAVNHIAPSAANPPGDNATIDDWIAYNGPVAKFQVGTCYTSEAPTPTPTPTELSCYDVCAVNPLPEQPTCPAGLTCQCPPGMGCASGMGYCVNTACPEEEDCVCATATPTATPTPPDQCLNGCLDAGEACDPSADDETDENCYDPNHAICADDCTLPDVDFSAEKTGPVCVETVAPNNRARFRIDIGNTTNNPIKITSISDSLPRGFTYVEDSTTIDGVSFSDANFSQTQVGNSWLLEWTNGSTGWTLAAGGSMILRFTARAGSNAIIGDNVNRAIVEAEGSEALDDITYTFDVAQTCSPETGIFDNIVVLILVSTVAIVVGIYFMNTNNPKVHQFFNSAFGGLTNFKVEMDKKGRVILKMRSTRGRFERKVKKGLKKSK